MDLLPHEILFHSRTSSSKGYVESLGDGVSLTLMLIPAGGFMMGAPPDEPASRDSERPQHWVKVPQFFMGRTPVTQAQWRVVAGYKREDIELNPEPSRLKDDNQPVHDVSWEEATEFCKRLAAKTQKNYYLPSEAQWEYACRASTKTAYCYGDRTTLKLANCGGWYKSEASEVGTYPPNRWGLYDMHGNVDEWCQDYWHDSYNDAPLEGSAWVELGDSTERVLRGGSWIYQCKDCRSASRYKSSPNTRDTNIGFRVCMSLPAITVSPSEIPLKSAKVTGKKLDDFSSQLLENRFTEGINLPQLESFDFFEAHFESTALPLILQDRGCTFINLKTFSINLEKFDISLVENITIETMDLDKFVLCLRIFLVKELEKWQPRLEDKRFRMFYLGCYPWFGYIELSFLTEDEDTYEDDVGDWTFYYFSSESTLWQRVVDVIGKWMQLAYEAEDDEGYPTIEPAEFLRKGAEVISSEQVVRVLQTYNLTDDFKLSVANEEIEDSYNYCDDWKLITAAVDTQS